MSTTLTVNVLQITKRSRTTNTLQLSTKEASGSLQAEGARSALMRMRTQCELSSQRLVEQVIS